MDKTYQQTQKAYGQEGWNNIYPNIKADSVKGNFGPVGGNGGNYTISLSPQPEAYVPGMMLIGRVESQNNSDTIKLKINGLTNPNRETQGGDWIPVKNRSGIKDEEFTFTQDAFKAGSTQIFIYDGLDFVVI